MTIMNLTQLALNETAVDNRIKRKLTRIPDIYSATSIEEMLDCFSENPPRKTGFMNLGKSAYIIMKNIKIKEHELNTIVFDDDPVSEFYQMIFDRFFFISDHTGYETTVGWIPKQLETYKKHQESLCINSRSYVRVPEICLEYEPEEEYLTYPYKPRGLKNYSLNIRSIKDNKPNARKPKRSIEFLISDLMPALSPI